MASAVPLPQPGASYAKPLIVAAVALSVLGLLVLEPSFALLWWKWTTDPLRSIGIVFFPVSILLLLREWRASRWMCDGTWLGLLPVAFAILCNLFLISRLEMVVRWKFSFNLVPVSVTPYAYVSGIVLLFGGVRLWKRAWFPLLLLLLLNPLPTSLVPLLDEHLQVAAAHITRMFASAIGFQPSTPQLLLMFSPRFGMFIAPGCDGVRGGVTFGYLALILGYVRRLPARLWMLFTLLAVLLGYVLNFARLCLLVVYYRIAMGHLRMENSAKNADYVIGGTLMLLATYFFFLLFFQAKPKAKRVESPEPAAATHYSTMAAKTVTLLLLLLYPLPVVARALRHHDSLQSMPLEERMPARVGEYVRNRVWRETIDGTVVMDDAAYIRPGQAGEVRIAVWVGSGPHDALDCLRLRDTKPEFVDNPVLRDTAGHLVFMDAGLFTDGNVDTALWNARCTTGQCLKVTNEGSDQFFLRIFNPGISAPTEKDRPVPILIRIDEPHTGEDAAVIYERMKEQARDFISSIDMLQMSTRFQ